MREAIELLKEAGALLRKVEEEEPIDQYTEVIMAKIMLAHASVRLAEAKLRLLMAQKEETCEKP